MSWRRRSTGRGPPDCMDVLDGQLILSATDLINFLECGHLTWLDLQRTCGKLPAKPKRPDTAELLAAKGEEHELAYLHRLKAEHGEALVEITADQGEDGLREAVT